VALAALRTTWSNYESAQRRSEPGQRCRNRNPRGRQCGVGRHRGVRCPLSVASMTSLSLGCTGISRCASSPPCVLRWSIVDV